MPDLLRVVSASQTFSTVSILGIVVLNGMDVTASILLVDLIMQRREEGVPRNDAVLAAGPVRLMPILMTVLVTMVVMAPVAFFPKTGIDAYSPLATVIVGGLAMSTVLTLLAVPVLYTVVDDVGEWLRTWWADLFQRRGGAPAVPAMRPAHTAGSDAAGDGPPPAGPAQSPPSDREVR